MGFIRSYVLAIVVLSLLLSLPVEADDRPGFDWELGSRLLAEGKYVDAIEAGGMRGDLLQSAMTQLISNSIKDEDPQVAARLYDAYFDFSPFGRAFNWFSHGLVVQQGVEFREQAGLATSPEWVDEVAASKLYAEIVAQQADPQQANPWDLLLGLARQHPNSRFCSAALYMVAAREPNTDLRYKQIQACIKLVSDSDPNPRRLVQLRIAALEQLTTNGLPAVAEAISRESTLLWEQRYYLLMAAGSHIEAVDRLRCYKEFLERFPGALESDRAVGGWVQTLLENQVTPAGALAELRAYESRHPGQDLSQALFAISKQHFQLQEYDASLNLLQEIHDKYQQSAIRARAQVGMAEVYHELGDEEQMVQAYKAAVSMPREQTNTDLMDASDTHNRAIQALGRHFLKKRKFKESMAYWKQWEPQSWCGTCGMQMNSDRRRMIALCLLQLEQPDQALAALVAVKHFEPDRMTSLLLIRMHERVGQLEQLGTWFQQQSDAHVQALRSQDHWKDRPESQLREMSPMFSAEKVLARVKADGFDAAVKEFTNDYQREEISLWDWPVTAFQPIGKTFEKRVHNQLIPASGLNNNRPWHSSPTILSVIVAALLGAIGVLRFLRSRRQVVQVST